MGKHKGKHYVYFIQSASLVDKFFFDHSSYMGIRDSVRVSGSVEAHCSLYLVLVQHSYTALAVLCITQLLMGAGPPGLINRQEIAMITTIYIRINKTVWT